MTARILWAECLGEFFGGNIREDADFIYGRIAETPCLKGNRGRGTRWWRQILDRKWKYGRFVHAPCTVRSLWMWLRGRYHVPQNVFLVNCIFW